MVGRFVVKVRHHYLTRRGGWSLYLCDAEQFLDETGGIAALDARFGAGSIQDDVVFIDLFDGNSERTLEEVYRDGLKPPLKFVLNTKKEA